jgi:hypothetical protein
MCVDPWERKEEIEWIRESKLPYFTDDNGDAHMFKKEYTDSDGQEHITNWFREYTGGYLENDMLSDAALGCWFNNIEVSCDKGETKFSEDKCLYMFTIFDKG